MVDIHKISINDKLKVSDPADKFYLNIGTVVTIDFYTNSMYLTFNTGPGIYRPDQLDYAAAKSLPTTATPNPCAAPTLTYNLVCWLLNFNKLGFYFPKPSGGILEVSKLQIAAYPYLGALPSTLNDCHLDEIWHYYDTLAKQAAALSPPSLMTGLAAWLPSVAFSPEERSIFPDTHSCANNMKSYVGLIDQFRYCSICDKKERT